MSLFSCLRDSAAFAATPAENLYVELLRTCNIICCIFRIDSFNANGKGVVTTESMPKKEIFYEGENFYDIPR